MQQCAHPAGVAFHIQECAHVAFAIDVDRIRVLVLAFSRIQVAAGQDGVDVAEPELAIGLGGQPHDILHGVQRVRWRRKDFWRLLKEGVGVVPRPQVGLLDVKASCEVPVEVGLHRLKRLTRGGVDFVQQLNKAVRLELVE